MNRKVEQKDFEKYLQEARCWETDKVRESERSEKIAWRVAAASCATAFAAVMAVAALMPLKTEIFSEKINGILPLFRR